MSLLLGVAVGLLVSRKVYDILYQLCISPLKVFPGPKLYAISHIPFYRARVEGRVHIVLQQLHAEYGPFVRVRPNEVSSISGKTWQEVYAHQPGRAEFVKADTGNRLNGGEGLLTANTDSHRRIRRRLSPQFSWQGLKISEPRIQSHVNLLMDGLSNHSGKGPVPVTAWMNWTTFNIIGDLGFGESFDCLEQEKTHDYIKKIVASLRASIVANIIRRRGYARLMALLMPKSMKKVREDILTFVRERVARRIALGEDRGDFLDGPLKEDLLATTPSPGTAVAKGMSALAVESTAMDLVLAGSETTATLLSGVIFHLLMRPSTPERASKEVREAFASDADITLSSATAERLPHLMAVLQESMRRLPPAPVLVPRLVPAGGAVVDGKHLPDRREFPCHNYRH